MRALKEGPVATAEKELTAEAVLRDDEHPIAEIITVAGMEPASSAAIFSENKVPGASIAPKND